jgi:hypothetical protein
MPRFLARGLLTAALIASATPALAQEAPLGSRLAQPQRTYNAKVDSRAVIVGHSFAACITRKRESSARRFIEATTAEEVDKIRTALFREVGCTNMPGMSPIGDGAMVASSPDIWRGMIAEQLLRQLPPVTLQPLPRLREYHSPWLAVSGRYPVVEEMAVCVAATNPSAIVSLLATTPESPQEQAAMRAMSPSFGPCLVVNARLTANRQSMRAALAEALYHRAIAEPAAAAAPATEKN